MTNSFNLDVQVPETKLPDISGFNYQDPADLAPGLEQNIKEDIADKQQYFQNLITQHNELEKIKNSKYKKLYELTRTGVRFGDVLWQEKRTREIIDDWNTTDEKYLTKWGDYGTFQEWQESRNNLKGEANAVIQNADENQIDEAVEMDSLTKPLDTVKSTLRNQGLDFQPFSGTAAQNMKVGMPDGKGGIKWITRATAKTSTEWWYAHGAIRKAWLMQAVGTKDQPVSNHMIRHNLYDKMKAIEEQEYKSWVTNTLTGVKASRQQTQKTELYEGIQSGGPEGGGAAILTHINNNFGDPKHGGSRALAKKATIDIVIDGVNNRILDASDVENIRNYTWVPFGSEVPKKFGDHFGPEMQRIDNALSAAMNEDALSMQRKIKHEPTDLVLQELQPYIGPNAKPLTIEVLNSIKDKVRDSYPNSPSNPILDLIQTTQEGEDTDVVEDMRLMLSQRKVIPEEMMLGMSDPDQIQKAETLIQKSQLLYGKHDLSNISTTSIDMIRESPFYQERYSGNLRLQRIVGNKIDDALKAVEARELAAEKPPAEALAIARREVGDRFRAGEFDVNPETFLSVSDKADNARMAVLTRDAILKDKTKVNERVRLPGENEQQIKSAFGWYRALKEGSVVGVPLYWKQVAKELNVDPKKYMESRLTALGLVDKGDLVTTDIEKAVDLLPPKDRAYLQQNPNESKTYVVASKDASWMLNVLNRGRDYNTIYDSEGSKADINITDLTVREVLELAKQGYTNIGGFDFLGHEGLQSAIYGTSVSLDQKFDERTQQHLVLGRLRYKAHLAGENVGLTTSYRRLVNVSEEDQKEWEKILPGLTAMNQIQNLLPAAVDAMLQL